MTNGQVEIIEEEFSTTSFKNGRKILNQVNKPPLLKIEHKSEEENARENGDTNMESDNDDDNKTLCSLKKNDTLKNETTENNDATLQTDEK